jgi:Txe/YoeB family toxin of Txe-Axe toxin-antitoxin module
MAVYRQVHCEFWQDAFVLDLTPEEKYFYIYLMTNGKTTQCGIYELPKRIMETETGYSRETVEKLLLRFIEYGKVQYNEATKEIFMLNWVKYNFINSPKVKKCIEKEISKVKHEPFKNLYASILKEYGYRIDSLSKDLEEKGTEEQNTPNNERDDIGYPYPIEGLSIDLGEEEEKEEEEEENKDSCRKRVYDEESTHYILASRLYNNILKNNPNHKKPNLNKWSDDIRKMIEIDNRTEEQIRYLIDWVQKDSFEMTNVLSTSKLRKRFDQLVMKVQRENKSSTPGRRNQVNWEEFDTSE